MTISILSIPGARGRYAVGLTWEHEHKRPTSSVRRRIVKTGGRWGAIRRSDAETYQVGHGTLPDGIKQPRAIRALAALVAEHFPSPWLGLYRIDDDHSWLIAVTRNGQIIPDGDRFGLHADMQSLRDALLAEQDWRQEEADAHHLATMIALAQPQPGLRDLARGVSPLVLAGAGAVVLGGAAAVGVILWQQEKEAAELSQRLDRQAAAQRRERARLAAEAAIPPWTRQATPAAVVSACWREWNARSPAEAGWQVASWTCSVSPSAVLIDTRWERATGVAAGAPGLLLDADHSSTSRQSPAALPVSDDARADSMMEARRAAWTLAQSYPMKLTLSAPAEASEKARGQDSTPPPPWLVQAAAFALPAPPWAFPPAVFDRIPALRVTAVEFQSQTGAWTVKTTLYGWRQGRGTQTEAQSATAAGTPL